ncbi:MAG: Pr6Pr family membrane protein [Nocardioidaceae bacterium]
MALRTKLARSSRLLGQAWNGTIALVVLLALVVQLWVTVRVSATPPAHAVGTLAGAPLAQRIVRVLSFFTVQSNLLSGLTSAQLAVAPVRSGPVWRAVRLASLFGITVTGIVYSTVLARVHQPHGWQETLVNDAFHYVVPVMMIVGWVLFRPRPRIDLATVGVATLWPVAWVTYSLWHGHVTRWYPYPFVDVATHGYAVVLWNSVLVVVVLAVVTALFWVGDRRLPPRTANRPML